MTFWPRLATWDSTCALAPLPMPTMAITAPTPMIIPRAVKPERILFLFNARRATRSVVKRVMRRGATRNRFSHRGFAPTRSLAPTKSKRVEGSLPVTPPLDQAYNHPVALFQPFDHFGMIAVANAGFDLHGLGDGAY